MKLCDFSVRVLVISLLVLQVVFVGSGQADAAIEGQVNWPEFIARQDMKWERVPTDWLQAPYLGNGMLGLLLFQEKKSSRNAEATGEKNILSLHVGRGDYYDNRPPDQRGEHTWIYRGRLPIGFYRIRSKGDVTGADWRLDLWNAKLTGTVTTTKGSYQIESLVHTDYDSFYFKVTPAGGEDVSFEWQPQECYSYPRKACEASIARDKAAGRESSSLNKNFTKMPYPKAPVAEVTESGDENISRQVLYSDSGELIVAWKVNEDKSDKSKTLLGTIAFSQKMGESLKKAKSELKRTVKDVSKGTYISSHQKWWNEYYPQSFVSISDDFWEQFYWIQMYKFASATRANGMMLDVMGPWYQPGFWPMIWTDLNVQLTYWTHLTANRLDVGASLMNQTDRHVKNLINNVPKDWRKDCLNAGTIFPADMKAAVGKGVADHMIWMLHDYWLHCRYADDGERMRDGLFPKLKRALQTNIRYLEANPVDLGDGKLHFKNTWSPEYPGGRGVDMNYTIALTKWAAETLLDINKEHGLKDPKAKDWQELLDKLPEYQVDDTGLRVGREVPFDKSHRHYSHLLAFYPLFDLTPEKDRELLKKSVDHWLAVAQNLDKKTDTARNVTGYTCTGGASMYASLNDGDTALHYLKLLPANRVSCTTMYAEGNPVIESPFSAATTIHDMLLLSYNGRIRIMPGVPSSWTDIHYLSLLCQGGVEVSADRADGKLRYVKIDSPNRARQVSFKMDMAQPVFELITAKGKSKTVKLSKGAEGFYKVDIPKEGSLQVIAKGTNLKDVKAVKSSAEGANIFGYNAKYDKVTERFPK